MQPHTVLPAQMDSPKPVPESCSLKVGWYVSTQGMAWSSAHKLSAPHVLAFTVGGPNVFSSLLVLVQGCSLIERVRFVLLILPQKLECLHISPGHSLACKQQLNFGYPFSVRRNTKPYLCTCLAAWEYMRFLCCTTAAIVDIALSPSIFPNPAGELNGLLMKKNGCHLMQMVVNHLQAHESFAVIVTCYSGLVSMFARILSTKKS